MKFYAKYPFLHGAEEIIKARNIDMEMLLADMAYEPARVRGKERIREAIENGEVGDRPFPKEIDQLAEILSYPIARMIVSCSGDRYLISRYALGEAMLLERRLMFEEDEEVLAIAEELGLETRQTDKGYLIHFTAYLDATSSIRAKEWKLVNQEIFSGMVRVSKEKFARVLRQRLNDRINSELPKSVTDGIMGAFGEDAKSYSSQMEAKRRQFVEGEMGPIDDTSFPPCMKTILTMMRAGENVPHTGRFAITSFLHTIGMNADKIMELFSTAPDFDAGKSEYQVRHIVGEISGTEYTPPECSTMKSYGICYNPDQLCQREWMTHPLKYYRNKKKWRRSTSERTPHPGEALKGGSAGREDEDEQKDIEKGDREA